MFCSFLCYPSERRGRKQPNEFCHRSWLPFFNRYSKEDEEEDEEEEAKPETFGLSVNV